MRVLGLEANVGSLLYPFWEANHEVIGNYDSRGIVNDENFSANFPQSVLYKSIDELLDDNKGRDIDVVMAQPSCSKFSPLSRKGDYSGDQCVDINGILAELNPKFYFIESKLGSLDEFKKIPGYRYQLEWVSNYHYGNTQKGRNRLWIMGIREDQDWKFVPNEQDHTNTVESVLEGLPDYDIKSIDHVHRYKPFLKNSITKEYLTLDEAFDMLKEQGKLTYTAADGTTKTRINRKIASKVTSTTITGGGTWFHWDKKYPLTIREKARIQGFPDEFSFKGLSNTNKDKAVGKSMPFEFTRYLVSILNKSSINMKPAKVVSMPIKLSMYINIHVNK